MIISDIFVEKTQIIFKVQTKFLQPSPDLLPWVPSENICIFTFNRMPSHFCVNQTEVFLISLSAVVLWVPLHMYLEWPGGNADEEGLSVPLETWNRRCTALCPREVGLTAGSCRAWVKVESWAQKRFYQVLPSCPKEQPVHQNSAWLPRERESLGYQEVHQSNNLLFYLKGRPMHLY